MPVWEIIGPVMTGPSSSHTAGAAHIGRIVRMCWGGEVKRADLYMRGSFASTGAGHGTDKALIAGLMGMSQDDPSIRDALELARAAGMEFHFYTEEVAGAHPNSVRVVVSGDDGRTMEAVGYSIGGGAVILHKLDGFQVDISCTLPAVIIMNRDVQGVVSAVTSYLSAHNVNIATMKLHRDTRGGLATMVIELDSAEEHADTEVIKNLHPGIVRVIGIEGED
ncbi:MULTISPECIES: L-serine ammonia-lyase, iron-sulfur-dependent subunit beta [Cloacibacillus]|jgi:L-serine dehydratase|uniref:L-serine dehydratase n=1 Tax=Cloacibacillus porcorum TaxID=1197717 RepID=A0A1B2I7H4_9BACT|nr:MULTISPECIES: L-serine ammonia-lyase, iron-sulfur-dependent subunit beta [Cloacibacillus]ANZ45928.1 L-serine dehydratase, iron-sulfur-dependent subunit beta [Cloacibacillus porcorum]MCC8058350.1 L-serine ammonia-lyase, iron-sulfur-dependent subunit beta [Cloacibacillus sp.]MCC8185148.1 L-serine ammonia-lyase, iron-sulfur-dependent subunit beta [Cloacibacillus porcorum]MCD8392461.1 L-serine ammonia-lyase, iron-sulfur-dependent subunit beta [Cloacibacillus porcorum]MCI5864637.1 L-serine ammon